MRRKLLYDLFLNSVVRLVLACILGGTIGYEREQTNRPAGFRTHILVCVGAALVMLTSEFIFNKYSGYTNLDPARLGAQVISGIGFLGAGTIIREGFSVKGLTTAASLWAVSCVGIAAGIGFYEGAIMAAILIYLTLIVLKKLEENLAVKNLYRNIFIESRNIPDLLGSISSILDEHDITIKNIEFISAEDSDRYVTKFLIKIPRGFNNRDVMSELSKLEGIFKVYKE
jgi:putative Mg2+ transporter-C (MgtC) family protein